MCIYPQLVVDLDKLENNIIKIKDICSKDNISIVGVVKGCNGYTKVAKVFDKVGVKYIASSRMEQLVSIKNEVRTPLMLIRIPMLSEVDKLVEICDVSLNSEIEVIKKINEIALKYKKIHNIILMKDLGDLREGFMSDDELIEAAILTEKLPNVHLLGIGTNLSCYGSIEPSYDNLNELVNVSKKIENKIGRKLEYISGGSTTSIPLIVQNNMPKGINLLRIGEGILLGNVRNCYIENLYNDVFKLKAEVIEVKTKPTYPIGKISYDAFGHKVKYVDKGIRKRAILALGKADYAIIEDLILLEKKAYIIGASSDHTIIDIEDVNREIKVGDIIEFRLGYSNLLHVTNSNNIYVKFKEKEDEND